VNALEIVKMQLQLLEVFGYIWVQSISTSHRLFGQTPQSIASIVKKKALQSHKEQLEPKYLIGCPFLSTEPPAIVGDHFIINHASATISRSF
jgi:hypothetical protein